MISISIEFPQGRHLQVPSNCFGNFRRNEVAFSLKWDNEKNTVLCGIITQKETIPRDATEFIGQLVRQLSEPFPKDANVCVVHGKWEKAGDGDG